jgi:hypothetical protein
MLMEEGLDGDVEVVSNEKNNTFFWIVIVLIVLGGLGGVVWILSSNSSNVDESKDVSESKQVEDTISDKKVTSSSGSFVSSVQLADVSELTGKEDQYYCEYDETRDKVAIIVRENGFYDDSETLNIFDQYFAAVRASVDVDNVGVKKFTGSSEAEFDLFIENLIVNENVGYIILVGTDLPILINDDDQGYIHLEHNLLKNSYSIIGDNNDSSGCIDVAISLVVSPLSYLDIEKKQFVSNVFTNFVNYHNNAEEIFREYSDTLSVGWDNDIPGEQQVGWSDPDGYEPSETVYFYPLTFLLNTNHEEIVREFQEKHLFLKYNVHGTPNLLGLGFSDNSEGSSSENGGYGVYTPFSDIREHVDELGHPVSLYVDILAACYSMTVGETYNDRFCCWPQTWLETGVWASFDVVSLSNHHNFQRWLYNEKMVGDALRKTSFGDGVIFGDILGRVP